MEAPSVDYAAMADASVEAVKKISQFNLDQFPKITGTALSQALMAGSALDQRSNQVFQQNLAQAFAGTGTTATGTIASMQDAQAKTKALADQMMTGALPQDVADSIARTRAELGIKQGAFGEISAYGKARDLGKTSLDMVTAGANMETQASQLSGNILKSALGIMAPSTNYQGLFAGMQEQLTGVATGSPTVAQQGTTQAFLTNANLQWDATLSNANMAMDKYAIQTNAANAAANRQAQMISSLIGAGGSAGGAMLGKMA